LGSTSLVTNNEGTVISETKYKAWGEVRYESASSPPEYTYTGQYSYTDDFGLMFYNARWYDSSLSRFAQADTIVPKEQGIQAWDRYAYGNNSPLRYTDPTGHVGCDEDANGKCINYEYKERKFYGLFAYANRVSKNQGKRNVLESMSKIVGKASEIYGNDSDGMMRGLSMIFLGAPEYGPGTLIKAENVLKSSEPSFFLKFGNKGFHDDFRDGQNQVHHVWAYIAETYNPGGLPISITAQPSNYYHEIEEYYQLKKTGKEGSSWDGFILSMAGIYIGININTGAVSLTDLDSYLLDTLGPNAPSYLLSESRSFEFPIMYEFLPKIEP